MTDPAIYRLEMAVPDLERPPSHPGAGGVAVRCQGRQGRCGQVLGVVAGGYFYLRHHEREATCPLPVWVRCEKCGARRAVKG